MKNVVLSLVSLLMFTGCEVANILAPEDCGGISGGNQIYDECGVCGGDNSSCSDLCGVPYGDNSSCCGESIPIDLDDVEIETILTSHDYNWTRYDIKITNISNDTLKYEDRPIYFNYHVFQDSSLYAYCLNWMPTHNLGFSINPNEIVEFSTYYPSYPCRNFENPAIGDFHLWYKCVD